MPDLIAYLRARLDEAEAAARAALAEAKTMHPPLTWTWGVAEPLPAAPGVPSL